MDIDWSTLFKNVRETTEAEFQALMGDDYVPPHTPEPPSNSYYLEPIGM